MKANLVGYIKAHGAADERKKIRKRTAQGKIDKVLDGKWMGTRPPLGYRKVGQRRDARLEINEQEAKLVLRIYYMYVGWNGHRVHDMPGNVRLNPQFQGAEQDMARPSQIDRAFAQLRSNFKLLKQLFKRQQKVYIRQRLQAIKWLWQGKSRQEVVEKLGIDRTSLLNWLHLLIEHGVEAGLKLLAQPKKVKKSGKLGADRQADLIDMLEHQKPSDYGYHQNIFTSKILVEVVEKEW
jgi:DNA invertase Pin-like site-specific DNA recombinase